MKKTTKIILITSGLLIAGAALFAFRKKPVAKRIGKILWPDDPDKSGIEITTETGETSIRPGSSGVYVQQLQSVLNALHKATSYINSNCGIKWGYFTSFPTSGNGNIINESGVYDDKTAQVAQFYLNRKEVDLEYLQLIKDKMKKWAGGDKCVYPLSVTV